jgi:hypothetical protein
VIVSCDTLRQFNARVDVHASARAMLKFVVLTLSDFLTAMKSRFGDKLRRAAKLLDELQQDIFAEDWDLIASYPNAFRALVPVFTKYTDAAFPGDDVSVAAVLARCHGTSIKFEFIKFLMSSLSLPYDNLDVCALQLYLLNKLCADVHHRACLADNQMNHVADTVHQLSLDTIHTNPCSQ